MPGFRLRFPRHAKGARDAFAGDVIMRRANAAGGEDMVEFRANLVDRIDDHFRHIGDHAHFLHGNADFPQPCREELQIGIPGAAGKHLIADDQQAGGRVRHGSLLS